MTAIAEAFLGRTATSYCTVGPLVEGQWPPIEEEGVFTWAIPAIFLPDIIHSNSPHGPIRELHRDDEINWGVNELAINNAYSRETQCFAMDRLHKE
jgi:hypothetical protein